MKRENNTEIVYSESITEIMGRPPGKLVRWGTLVIICVFLLLVMLAAVIRYPDAVTSPVEITTVNPPVTMVSKITGRIKNLYVTDKEVVSSGRLLAVMETAASVNDVNRLKNLADSVRDPGSLTMAGLPVFTDLGEIQQYWSLFLKSLSDFENYSTSDFYGKKMVALNSEIRGITSYMRQLKAKEKLYAENRQIEEKHYRRDSLLRVSEVYSENDLEKSRQSLIRLSIDLQQVRLDYSEKSIDLGEKQQLLQDYSILKVTEKEKYYSVLKESFLNLRAQIKIWENNYLLISPIAGMVTFTKFWNENQSVSRDEPVLTVIPSDPGDYVARISLNMSRSGKVKEGQMVNIKLSGFPYLEYGMVRGIVKSKSLVPSADAYTIELTLPSGLETLYGKNLDFTHNMQGSAEIITDDLSLLTRIIDPFRYLVSRNKR
jgi:multidrug resistance efflux pump